MVLWIRRAVPYIRYTELIIVVDFNYLQGDKDNIGESAKIDFKRVYAFNEARLIDTWCLWSCGLL